MSKQTQTDLRNAQDEETLAKLMQIAGSRAEIPSDIEARVYSRVLDEWQSDAAGQSTARNYKRTLRVWRRNNAWSRGRRWAIPLGVAASIIVALVVVTPPEPPARLSVGTINRISGFDPGDAAVALGADIYVGDTLTTSEAEGLSLLLDTNTSLRIGEHSTVRIDAKDTFTLFSGRLYADTGEFVYRGSNLAIETELGSIRDVGTQFAVAVDDARLDIAVREGRVDVQQEQHEFVAVAGERMQLTEGGHSETSLIAPNADYWNWVSDLAPYFDIENRSLLDFLKWVARETGTELSFANDETRMAAMRTDLHGSIADFSPFEALQSVLATTSFRYGIEGHLLLISE